jgi:hypothetical protein
MARAVAAAAKRRRTIRAYPPCAQARVGNPAQMQPRVVSASRTLAARGPIAGYWLNLSHY